MLLTAKLDSTGSHTLSVEGSEGTTTITFENAIVAAGSRPIELPFYST